MLSVKVLVFLAVSMTCALAAESRATLGENQVVGSACPKSDFVHDSELAEVLETESEEEQKIAEQAAGQSVTLPNLGQQRLEQCAEPEPSVQEANVCSKDLVVPDSPEEEPASRKKRQIGFVKRCDACPSYQRFLRRHGSCYVVWWSLQQIRTVVCPQRPWYHQVCDCGNPLLYRQICVRTHWIRVWFFAWCPFSSNLPWGYRPGLNYNFRWLAQDCQCRCYRRRRC